MNQSAVRLGLRTLLTLIAAGGLAYDAYAHFDLAATYDVIKTSTLSQGDLFRAEGVAAIAAAAAVVLRPRRYTALLALAVAASALGAVLLYRYNNVGAIGPIPSMYEPAWYPEKTQSAWAEGIAAAASIALFAVVHLDRRHRVADDATGSPPSDESAATLAR
ncbi:MAG: hypothetical protein QOI15_1721 [Pseudonocardiales bacterium]|nr:hypothetical protein [Pseudonocardiales bacterium]MDT4920819.1 hypothetical protein [Pseudonocardiales bacterium]